MAKLSVQVPRPMSGTPPPPPPRPQFLSFRIPPHPDPGLKSSTVKSDTLASLSPFLRTHFHGFLSGLLLWVGGEAVPEAFNVSRSQCDSAAMETTAKHASLPVAASDNSTDRRLKRVSSGSTDHIHQRGLRDRQHGFQQEHGPLGYQHGRQRQHGPWRSFEEARSGNRTVPHPGYLVAHRSWGLGSTLVGHSLPGAHYCCPFALCGWAPWPVAAVVAVAAASSSPALCSE